MIRVLGLAQAVENALQRERTSTWLKSTPCALATPSPLLRQRSRFVVSSYTNTLTLRLQLALCGV